jgi:hypothetical protein
MNQINSIESTETTNEPTVAETPVAEKKASKGNGYCFPSQKEIVAQLSQSSEFRVECLEILVARQTNDELEEKATKYSNKRGLRCSESVYFPTLLSNLRNDPAAVTSEDFDRLARTLPTYRKQLAQHFRLEMIKADPTLAAQAAKFGL